MERKAVLLTIVMLIIVSPCLEASSFRWGYVDGARLIQLHPLMKQYDSRTRRFTDTVSQPRPSEDPREFINRLQGRLASMKEMLAKLDANYAGKISDKGMAARKSWWNFWKKRESIKIYHNLLQEAITQAAIHGNFYLNMPSDWTLMPVTMAISSSVSDACEYLRANHKLDAVLDSSVFISKLGQKSLLAMLPNPHWKVWSGAPVAAAELEVISDSLASSLRQSFARMRNRPFVAGVMDLREQCESLLTDITLPSSSLPGDDAKSGE